MLPEAEGSVTQLIFARAGKLICGFLDEGEWSSGVSPLPGMAAVTWSIFMPRPGSRVTERNSVVAIVTGLRVRVTTSSPPICTAAGAGGAGFTCAFGSGRRLLTTGGEQAICCQCYR